MAISETSKANNWNCANETWEQFMKRNHYTDRDFIYKPQWDKYTKEQYKNECMALSYEFIAWMDEYRDIINGVNEKILNKFYELIAKSDDTWIGRTRAALLNQAGKLITDETGIIGPCIIS